MATLAALVGVLAITKYFDLSELTEDSMESGVIVAVQQGLAGYAEESRDIGRKPVYPEVLDNASLGDTGMRNPFFANVLERGIAVAGWSKTGINEYATPSGVGYVYNPDTGSFEPNDAPPPKTESPAQDSGIK